MIYLIAIVAVCILGFLIWKSTKTPMGLCGCEKCTDENCKCEENKCEEDCKCHDVPAAETPAEVCDVFVEAETEVEAPSPYMNGHSEKITAVPEEEKIDEAPSVEEAPPVEAPKEEKKAASKKPAPKKKAPAKKPAPKKKKK